MAEVDGDRSRRRRSAAAARIAATGGLSAPLLLLALHPRVPEGAVIELLAFVGALVALVVLGVLVLVIYLAVRASRADTAARAERAEAVLHDILQWTLAILGRERPCRERAAGPRRRASRGP